MPDEIKALRGNPGKRRLVLNDPGRYQDRVSFQTVAIKPPDFLTQERERAIFQRIIDDYLQRRVARPGDIDAYGRWASYVHRWITCKEQLDGKATFYRVQMSSGERLMRHPSFADMIDLERLLQSLEDRLGLNPVARQHLIRGLMAKPIAAVEEPPEDDVRDLPPKRDDPARALDSPLGFLQVGKKPN